MHDEANHQSEASLPGYTPMPRRSTGVLTRMLSPVSGAVRRTEAQREPWAAFWDEHNAAALDDDGPLWVALGDSTSQGIGAATPEESWVWRVLERLRSERDRRWQVLNVSITGAQFSDIIDHQLPRLAQAADSDRQPSVVTHLAGANNLMAPGTWPVTIAQARRVFDALPAYSVVARTGVAGPMNSLMARRINAALHAVAPEKSFELFWPWSYPAKEGTGDDRWHPSSVGYGYMADNIYPRVIASLDGRD